MKVAYFAESPADEAALRILTESILNRKTDTIYHNGLRHRGWPAVRTVLPVVLKELHYHTEAEGFVLIVDSNGATPHSSSHEQPNASDPNCRLCQLRRITDETLGKVRPRTNGTTLKIALGLAVPAIEGWLLCGVDSHVTEAAWINGLKENRRDRMPYTKKGLKHQLYGTSHPSLVLETEKMKAAATRLSADLTAIQNLFPGGFGPLVKSLRAW